MSEIVQWGRDFAAYVRDVWESEWLPISHAQAIAGGIFFLWFLWYAIGKEGGDFAFLDAGNVVIHEGGHALFSHFGDLLMVAGGTILQLAVPLLLALAFYMRRQAIGYAVFLLVVFENLLYVAKYMSDARAQALSYVAIGVGAMEGLEDPRMHDWYNLFERWGLLPYDTRIAAWVFRTGWIGMIGVVLWFFWRCARSWNEAPVQVEN